MKKIYIVRHGCKEYANRLWSDMSIYAFGLETGASVLSRTYLEHISLLRPVHELYWRIIRNQYPHNGVWTWSNWKLLPPSRALPQQGNGPLFFFGWLFRNPDGFQKYRTELIKQFGPSKNEEHRLLQQLSPFRDKHLMGLHIRTKAFTYFSNGEFLVTPQRVRQIVEEYLKEQRLTHQDAVLVIATDSTLPSEIFKDFSKYELVQTKRESLLLLSKCKVIIGTNTTHSNLAAWFANAAHIVTTNEPIEWEYYRGKKTYFDNKFATFAFGSVEKK